MLVGAFMMGVGLLLAFNGRRLVWLLIAAAGFILGYSLTRLFLPAADALVELMVGLILGLLFAFLARSLTRFALGVAGFLLVGGLALTLAEQVGFNAEISGWLIFLIGGLLGIGLMLFAFDISIILFSVVGGAILFTEGLPALFGIPDADWIRLAGLVLAVVGFIAQWQARRKRH